MNVDKYINWLNCKPGHLCWVKDEGQDWIDACREFVSVSYYYEHFEDEVTWP